MEFEEQYQDVLQNIEFGIISVYQEHPEMVDHTAMRALEALIDHYVAQKIGRAPKRFNLDPLETETFERMKSMCDWRLGLAEGPANISQINPLTLDEILQCLKRILKSTHRWNKQSGRRGYLDFVAKFVR
ncbi:MAG: hypothetical protein EA420_09190 [Candidatus Competibacteraceae bacterium]|nr:MAG: hypothetical protein EA420_09190 [Candidatus Competibacteraceae bacterium]